MQDQQRDIQSGSAVCNQCRLQFQHAMATRMVSNAKQQATQAPGFGKMHCIFCSVSEPKITISSRDKTGNISVMNRERAGALICSAAGNFAELLHMQATQCSTRHKRCKCRGGNESVVPTAHCKSWLHTAPHEDGPNTATILHLAPAILAVSYVAASCVIL